MSAFVENQKKLFENLTQTLLSELNADEKATFNLDAEDSFFIRFNQNKIRQNTHLQQIVLSLTLQKNQRTCQYSWTLAGDFKSDLEKSRKLLQKARLECEQLPMDPFLVEIKNNGQSENIFSGFIPATDELLKNLTDAAQGLDLAGFWTSGPLISANCNSEGQRHWFSNEVFFMDYSLFNQEKASKGTYSGACWNVDEYRQNVQECKAKLEILKRPNHSIQPGKFRCYLEPNAVSEIISVLSWNAMSQRSLQHGQNPFRKLAETTAALSPLFSLKENFSLGIVPPFNSLGELSQPDVTLIQHGQFKQFLISSKTAHEFSLKGNAAEENEGLRSPEVLPGQLQRKDILKSLDTGLYLSNLHYVNWSDLLSARITGMTRYACCWVEKGEVVGPIKDLRFDESLLEALGPKLAAVTDFQELIPNISTYGQRGFGGQKLPGLLINDFTFTL